MSPPPVLVVQNDADDPLGPLGDWLTEAGLVFDVRLAFAGAPLPGDLSGHGGLIVLGGAPGAHDDAIAPWLSRVRMLLAHAIRAEVPTLAICLGAQLLAVATGGRVERGRAGPELGPHLIAKRAAAATDPLFGPMPITPDVLQWHYDAITELPPSAVLLASSPVYEVQAFRLGRLAWGVQCHIETTPATVRRWAETDLAAQDYDLSGLLARSDAVHDDIAAAWAPVAARFADVVRAPEAVAVRRGPVVTSAAPVDDPAAIRAALAMQMNSARMPGPGAAARTPVPFGRPASGSGAGDPPPLWTDRLRRPTVGPRSVDGAGRRLRAVGGVTSAAPGAATPRSEVMERVAARLVRLGFSRTGGTSALLTAAPLRLWDQASNAPTDDGAAAIVVALSRSADPDRAAEALARLAEAQPAPARLRAAMGGDADLRVRLLSVLGASVELGHHLVRHPMDWTVLLGPARLDAEAARRALAAAVGADADDPVTGSAGTPARVVGREAVLTLRAAYRRQLLAIAGRDLSGELSMEDVSAALARLAASTLQAGLAVAAGDLAATERGAGETGADRTAPAWDLAVVAMGKTGGLELNYVSDVDVVFVAEPGPGVEVEQALAGAERLAGQLMRVCGEAVWEVDAGLRPEGKDGPLVRTLASHLAYYRRWASTWEFQALLKARPAAGSLPLARRYIDSVAPLVWTAAERPGFVADVQAMRRRVVAELPAGVAPREIKLGPGGLRDVEFAIQLLQMVHGRGDESLRAPGTLAALGALRDGGFIGRDDAISLGDAYRFLRGVEHRAQLTRLRRTHLVPERPGDVARLARAMGFRPDHRGDATAVWASEWALHAREVRRLHEKLFYRPLLEAVARVPSAELRLTAAEAGRRLAALGFAQPERALQHIDALTAGLSRRAAIQRALLPVLLADFSNAPDPDAGLLRYRRVSEAAGNMPWYLRTLRDEGQVANRLAYLLGTSRYLADLLASSPDALRMLADDGALPPRTAAEVTASMRETAARQNTTEAAVRAVRAVRRTELVRIASADLLGLAFVEAVSTGLSATVDASLTVALELAAAAVSAAHGWSAPPRLAIIAMGRLGGSELGYGSDADVLFVYEAIESPPAGAADDAPAAAGRGEDAARFARETAELVRSCLGAPGADPPVDVDTSLRPEGRDGPLVRSLASYAAYYTRWASVWEAQALLRARVAGGDADLGARWIQMIAPVRYPEEGLTQAQVTEIRRLKARIDSERLPRGADPATHTKLGRGGLADVEWTLQLLQLRHAHAVPELRTTSTIDGLTAAAAAGLISADEMHVLLEAWRRSTRTRNALMLVRGKAEDQLPPAGPALTAVGRAMGYPAGFEPGRLDDDYRRVARRARHVVETIFYDGVR